MKKTGLLNQPISALIAGLGHGDEIVIADCGLPIPDSTQRIDIALKRGVPTFIETLRMVLEEMEVETAVIATEMPSENPAVHAGLNQALSAVPTTTISHADLKDRAARAKATIRTGENTPYSNVILVSGIAF